MNEQILAFWNHYWKNNEQHPPTEVDAFQFGSDADHLAQLVVSGQKTATCSAHILYELENEELPAVGQYSIVLDSFERPVAIIQVTDITIQPMNEVPVEFALAEGEGDYTYWWNEHERFFTEELSHHHISFSKTMQLVCERFEMVYQG